MNSVAEKAPIQTATLAEIYYKQGFLEKSRSVYEGLLDANPGNEQAQTRIHQITQELKAPENQNQHENALIDGSTDVSHDVSVLAELQSWLDNIQARRHHV